MRLRRRMCTLRIDGAVLYHSSFLSIRVSQKDVSLEFLGFKKVEENFIISLTPPTSLHIQWMSRALFLHLFVCLRCGLMSALLLNLLAGLP